MRGEYTTTSRPADSRPGRWRIAARSVIFPLMLVLGIETSCDETAAAVVASGGMVLSSVVAGQVDLHAAFGGVVPELASRRHLEAVIPVVRQALSAAGVRMAEVDGIAVTAGPGLVGALMVGTAAAGAMAWAAGKPLVGVNHVTAHIMAVFLEPGFGEGAAACARGLPAFPFMALVVSGGHTSLFLVGGPGSVRLVGRTRDDAAGEALDKGAALMGLGYPGGPEIEKRALAFAGKPSLRFPEGMRRSGDLDFSFSGVKTALALRVRALAAGGGGTALAPAARDELCKAYEEAIVRALARKAIGACRQHGTPSLVVAGGVASNARLRREFHERCPAEGIAVHFPYRQFCTDNAAMIAYAGEEPLGRGVDETGRLRVMPCLDEMLEAV